MLVNRYLASHKTNGQGFERKAPSVRVVAKNEELDEKAYEAFSKKGPIGQVKEIYGRALALVRIKRGYPINSGNDNNKLNYVA